MRKDCTMAKRIVIALGGNALGKNLQEQMDAVNITAKAIADLIEEGYELVIAHGMSQAEVARRFGVTDAAVSQYIKG